MEKQTSIRSYFSTAKDLDDIIPRHWLTEPLPKKPEKRSVGRPRKSPYPAQTRKAVVPQCEIASDLIDLEPASETAPTTPKRGRYHFYSITDKREMQDVVDQHGVRAASRLLNMPYSTLRSILKQDLQANRTAKGRLFGGGRKLAYTNELDEKVLEWTLSQRDMHIPVTLEMLRMQALKVIRPLFPEFKASSGWITSFKRRHSLSVRCRTSLAQRLPADLQQKSDTFHKWVRETVEYYEVDDELIINMDETPVYFDTMPTRTLERRGASSVMMRSTGGEKRRVTVVLTAVADGHMLQPMVVFQGKRELKVSMINILYTIHILLLY